MADAKTAGRALAKEISAESWQVRIHRSTLVNLEHISELYSWFGGKVLLRLNDPKKTELTVARERVKEIRERLGL